MTSNYEQPTVMWIPTTMVNSLNEVVRSWQLQIADRAVAIATFCINPELGLTIPQERNIVQAMTDSFLEGLHADGVLKILEQRITH